MRFSLLPPALILMVSQLPPNTGGCANGPVVRLLHKYENDEGILKHELQHVLQFWIVGILASILIFTLSYFFKFNSVYAFLGMSVHSVLYSAVKPYRYWAETQAYAKQLQYSVDKEKDVELFGRFIADAYNLNITKEQATERLRKTLS